MKTELGSTSHGLEVELPVLGHRRHFWAMLLPFCLARSGINYAACGRTTPRRRLKRPSAARSFGRLRRPSIREMSTLCPECIGTIPAFPALAQGPLDAEWRAPQDADGDVRRRKAGRQRRTLTARPAEGPTQVCKHGSGGIGDRYKRLSRSSAQPTACKQGQSPYRGDVDNER